MGEIRKENLHQSLIEYLDGLGLTEEQVQGLISAGLVDTNTLVNELHASIANAWQSLEQAWATINEINTRELNAQQYKLTESNGSGIGWSYQDANLCIGNGRVYIGEAMANAPSSGVGHWYTIESYNDGTWGYQVATDWFNNENRFIRSISNGTWLAWRSL